MKKKFSITVDKIPSIICFVFLICLYIATDLCSRKTSVSGEMFTIFGHPMPIASLAGVFSSISTIIIISLVVFYRKIGFYTSIVILILRILKLTSGILHFHASSFPALFITLVALVSVILIYRRNEKIQRVQEKHRKELVEFTDSIIDAFSVCIDGKDSYTNGHSLRVAKYTKMLALKLGVDKASAQKFYNIALLHDIGKIGIPDKILTGELTRNIMRKMLTTFDVADHDKKTLLMGPNIIMSDSTEKDIRPGFMVRKSLMWRELFPLQMPLMP